MFCLRSYIPLLFLPLKASPLFVISFLLLTYFLNRPCIYCSALLLILFISSCYWSDTCILDFTHNDFFSQRQFTSPIPNPLPQATNCSGIHENGYAGDGSFLITAVNETASTLAGAAVEEMRQRMTRKTEWTGVGLGWMRSWLGGREFRLPCVDVYVRL
ncbi:hypothetical protein ABVK25_001458 [Lepraria finkii]|uniref:Bladder cancer-related BC10-like protein n=1 Tax=Lepraria finkii TaxID=1340010 RepID=A0ABR4BLW9_9LECA